MEGWLLSFILASSSSLLWTTLSTPLSISIYFTFSLALLLRFSNFPLSTWASGFFAGLVWISSVGHWYQYWQLQVDDFNQTILIEGEIDTLMVSKRGINASQSKSKRFNVHVTAIDGKSVGIAPYTFRISWYRPDWLLKQGQKVQLQVKIKPAHGLANEGGFNYQQWLFSQKIQATGYVKTNELNRLLDAKTTARQRLLDTLLSYRLPQERWIVALSLGYRGLLDSNDWQLLQDTGTAHLVAISGLHMAVVGALSYFLFINILQLLVRFHWLKANTSLHKAGLVLSLTCCLFYAYLAGFSIPTVRAWTMMFVVILLMLFFQSWSKVQSLLALMFVVILLFPLSLYGTSFWLSFLAVTIILYSVWLFPTRTQTQRRWSLWLSAIRLQFTLSLFMMPFILWQFSMLSFSSPLINIIAVPLVTLLLVPICVVSSFLALFSPQIAEYGFVFVDTTLSYCVDMLTVLSNVPLSAIDVVKPSIYAIVGLSLFVVMASLPKLPIPRYFCFIWLLPLANLLVESKQKSWQVDVLDVGQGLSVLITQGRRVILYDTGPSFPSGFSAADAAIVPLLRSRGIKSIDLLIISHNDNDHAGGAKAILSSMAVKRVISSEDSCFNGWHKQWGELELRALWPLQAMSGEENESSCVIMVSDANYSVLMTGDIDKRTEQKLIKLHQGRLSADLMTAPHHGSNSSSSLSFIKQVSPSYVVFSQGFLNRWQFPREDVVRRYDSENVTMFSTSVTGQMSFIFSENNVIVERYRHDMYPYWYANKAAPYKTNEY